MIKQSYVVNVSNVGLTSDFSVFPEDLRLYAVESRVEQSSREVCQPPNGVCKWVSDSAIHLKDKAAGLMIVGLSLLKIINKVIHLAIPIIVHILSFIMTLCILSNRIPVRQKSIFERKLTFKFTHDISYKDYLDTLSNKHSLDIELKIYKTRGLAS